MKIGIDIDDTITNTTEKISEYMEKLGISTKDDFCNYTDKELENYNELLVKYMELVLSTCTLKDNCVKVINNLKKKGHKIYIITARTNKFSKNIYNITKCFLDSNNILYDELLFGYEDKRDICIEKELDYMIDDNINVYNSLLDTKVRPVLFSKKQNKEFDCIRVNDWLEIEQLINK